MENNISQNSLSQGNLGSQSYIDLSLINETSSEIISTKYPNRKTTLQINFVKFSPKNKINAFIVTIIRKVGMFYSAYDQSTYFLVKSKENLIANKKYLIYGKIKNERIIVLYAEFIELINYKKILHELL